MAQEVSKVLWRNTKKHVEKQIGIPPQTEKVYWLQFSPFEVHLYECVREQFRDRLANRFRSTNHSHTQQNQKSVLDYNQNLRLDELDRQTINTLLAPILNLRITCNHPQLILRRTDFMQQPHTQEEQDKLLSMEKSLELLKKKTTTEAETIFRQFAESSYAICGLKMIQENVKSNVF